MMKSKIFLVVIVAVVACAVAASAVEIVGVLRGNVVLAKKDGQVLGLRLSGVWVPTPPGLGEEVQYRGAEARQFVIDAIDGQPLRIQPLGKVQPGKPLWVRILVGPEGEGERDLSVMLAEAGLALAERNRAASEEQGEAIYRAERKARATRRGMHDGGYATFMAKSGREEINFGLAVWLDAEGSGGPTGTSRGGAAGGAGAGNWWVSESSYDIHNSAVDAIRDYGASMGLPPDHSSHGR